MGPLESLVEHIERGPLQVAICTIITSAVQCISVILHALAADEYPHETPHVISLKLVARRNVTRVRCLLLAVPVPSFVGAWPQRRRGDTCQAQAMDVATMGGAVFGTSVALIFGPLQGKKDFCGKRVSFCGKDAKLDPSSDLICLTFGICNVSGSLGYDWASRKELERPYLEMRVVDASINEEGDELMRRVEALTVLEGEGLAGDPGSGWSRVYGVYGVAPPEKSSYQSEALRISGEAALDGKGLGRAMVPAATLPC